MTVFVLSSLILANIPRFWLPSLRMIGFKNVREFFFFLASDKNPNLTHFHKSLVWKSVIKWHKSTTFFLVVFGVSKLDYLLNVQGSIFAWRVHHMSDKSHALEMEFTEMKSRVTAYSFLYHGSKNQSISQKYEAE